MVPVMLAALAAAGGEEDIIALAACTDARGMKWQHVSAPNIPANSSFVVVGTEQCMNVEAWGKSQGDKIWATTCKDEGPPKVLNRVWLNFPNGSIVNPVSKLCLGVKHDPGYPVEAGDTTCLMSCTAKGASKWKYDEKTQYITHVDTGLCVAAHMRLPPSPAPPTPVPSPRTVNLTVSIDGSAAVAHSADGYVSFNLDWHKNSEEPPGWINMSSILLDLDDPMLIQATTALAPGHLRIGGSEGDVLVYDVPSHNSTCASRNQSDPSMCLNMARWEQLVGFADKTGVQLVFGLNAMNGRASSKGTLNMDNIEAFLAYTAEKKLKVKGFELGNELPHIDPHVMATDYHNLHALLTKYWPDSAARPLLIGNDMNSNPTYLTSWLPLVADVLDVMTYHHYDGYGLDKHLASEIMSNKYLDGTRQQGVYDVYHDDLLALTDRTPELWVGEAAAAWHSGGVGVTNAFVSSYWYADALAGQAAMNHSAYCRQTLVGGYYGLLNRTTFEPNPDFYVSQLHKQLMGNAVLRVSNVTSATSLPRISNAGGVSLDDPIARFENLRVYAQCSRSGNDAGGAATVLFINLDSAATYVVEQLSDIGSSFDFNGARMVSLSSRLEYQLSAESLSSRYVSLNSYENHDDAHTLRVDPKTGKLPPLTPKEESGPISLPPHTISYMVLPDAKFSACR